MKNEQRTKRGIPLWLGHPFFKKILGSHTRLATGVLLKIDTNGPLIAGV
jgi:hypothetical protein